MPLSLFQEVICYGRIKSMMKNDMMQKVIQPIGNRRYVTPFLRINGIGSDGAPLPLGLFPICGWLLFGRVR